MFGKLVEINEPSGVEHPHLLQLSNDLRLLRHIEELAEYVDIIVNDPNGPHHQQFDQSHIYQH